MSFPAVVHGEWIKVRSLRSTTGSLISIFFATTAVSVLICATLSRSESGGADFDPVRISYDGLSFGQLAAITFGAMAMAGEYRNAGIQVSLAAVPNRGLFYAAKLAVVGGLALVVGLVTSLVCFLSGQALIGAGVGIGDRGALRAVIGCGLYFACVALLATGLAALLRSVTGVLTLLIPLFLFLPFVIGDVSGDGSIADFFPDSAGRQILVQDPSGALGPWTGMAVLAGWAAAAVLAGWFALRRRDA
jgi:hypothetical protein